MEHLDDVKSSSKSSMNVFLRFISYPRILTTQLLLGDPKYMKVEMFIHYHIGVHEHPPDVLMNAINAFNKMYACYRFLVEWDIRGLTMKVCKVDDTI